ncbi:MAG TPA: nicotinate phosphoribosyltransferase [Gemmatimonadales bacterium]|jgi:nicotinate phosphoribosyltransferase|nr:nicotinate phosphoribosyltransferase [Gemmatimonadales bacterium]
MAIRDAEGGFDAGPLRLGDAALFTDLYELTMAAAFFRHGIRGPASFSLFVRRLPETRAFLVAAGLEDALDFLHALRFSSSALAHLRTLGLFDEAFLEWLVGFRFTGEVRAVPEGTVVFADEPILEVSGPILEAQMVESALLNFCHLQTLLASKAARVVLAAGGRSVAEFGLRRTPGIDAAMKAARSAYIAGCELTSNVLAGMEYAIPVTGTMAHSFVTAFTSEMAAFRAFAETFPAGAVLLLDSYDTVAAAHKAVEVAGLLAQQGRRLAGVRLDSGDIVGLSRQVRAILDAAGLAGVPILVSGGLDEHAVEAYLAAGAPIDAFGIGTRMNVSADAPSLDMVYKLVRFDGRDILKLSQDKETWVGEKQILRTRRADGRFAADVLALEDEPVPAGAEPLLQPVMARGELLRPHPALDEVRAHCAAQLASLPEELRRLRDAGVYPVSYSRALRARQASAIAAVAD